MTPRSKIVALQTDDTVADLIAAAAESGFSRFPIVDGDLDETVGIVHVKQVFASSAGRSRAHPADHGRASRFRWCPRRWTATR